MYRVTVYQTLSELFGWRQSGSKLITVCAVWFEISLRKILKYQNDKHKYIQAFEFISKFVGPCIVIYFYSKTNQMHNISNLFYFATTLYMFRTVTPSIIRSLRLYIQHQVYVTQVLWLLAVCTVLDSWWWTEKPSETCRVLFQNKINLRYCASGWFYYRNYQ